MLQTVPMKPRNHTQKENTPLAPNAQDLIHDSSTVEDELDDTKTQTRILRLRKTTFRGGSVAPRNGTPIAISQQFSPGTSSDIGSIDAAVPSPLEARSRLYANNDARTDSTGVLQEISNSSMRRKRKDSRRVKTSLPQPPHDPESCRETFASARQPTSAYPVLSPDTFSPLDALTTTTTIPVPTTSPSRSSTMRRRSNRSSRRSISNIEVSKYIEHLESQLASLQTQVDCVTSPSTSRAHAAKLRAMTSESRLLRQEVSDWETKFSERIKEYTEHQEVVVGSLRLQVRSLERETEATQVRLQDLETEINEKQSYVEAVDMTNQDLERRLGIMSELLATSSTKLDSCPRASGELRRKSPTRPLSIAISSPNAHKSRLKLNLGHARKFTSLDSGLSRHSRIDSSASPSCARPSRLSGHYEYSHASLDAEMNIASTDEESEMSESTLIDEPPLSPTHKNLFLRRAQADNESRPRPSRKMRRFHGGVPGPRTLILPATSSQPKLTSLSAPVTAQPTPIAMVRSPSDLASPEKSIWPAAGSRTVVRKRSATFNDNDSSAVQSRHHADYAILTSEMPCQRPTALPPVDPSKTFTPKRRSGDSVVNRYSIGLAGGKNLFEELESLIDDEAKSWSDDQSIASTNRKHQGSRTPSTSSWDLEPSPGSSPSPLPEPDPRLLPADVPRSPGSKPETTIAASARNTSTNSTRLPLPLRPLQLIYTLVTAVSRTLDRRTGPIRSIVTSAWDAVMLSRPVLEFRWWLVKLLLGDLHRKRRLWPSVLGAGADTTSTTQIRGSSPFSGHTGGISHGDSQKRISNSGSDKGSTPPDTPIEARTSALDGYLEQLRSSPRPPRPPDGDDTSSPTMTWLRFGVTLVFAVGVALRDGPGQMLLVPVGRRRGEQVRGSPRS